VDGTPQGLRVVERMGWTGSCLAFARSDYAQARSRPEVARAGVYVLVGPDPDGHRTQRVYVGEADEVRTRLDAHQKEKDFWTHGFVLSTKDESLNKAHVRYLESRLLRIARVVDAASLDNGTAPPLPRLSEPEVAEMETYLRDALTLFPLVGVTVFDLVDTEEVPEPRTGGTATDAAWTPPSGDVVPTTGPVHGPAFFLRTHLTQAEGRDDARGFLVYEGATARAEAKVMIRSYQQIRDRLISEGTLVPHGVGQLRLTKNFVFESPSAAASVLSGGSKNGRISWVDGTGRTLKERQEQSAS
jgi:hypothetical protein